MSKHISQKYSHLETLAYNFYSTDKEYLVANTNKCQVAIFWHNMLNSEIDQFNTHLCDFQATDEFIEDAFVSDLAS